MCDVLVWYWYWFVIGYLILVCCRCSLTWTDIKTNFPNVYQDGSEEEEGDSSELEEEDTEEGEEDSEEEEEEEMCLPGMDGKEEVCKRRCCAEQIHLTSIILLQVLQAALVSTTI